MINREGRNHQTAVAFFQRFRGKLWSTEAVLTEVAYVLATSLKHQVAALNWLQRAIDAGMGRLEGIPDLSRIGSLLT